jgi:group I intron endonuclease
MIGIYKITSPTKRIYIGQSIDIEFRFTTYKKMYCKGQTRLYASFKKYGTEKHIFEIITECEIFELNEKERYYQELYNTLDKGLNCQFVKTDTQKYVHSKETKQKISASNTGKLGRKGVKFSEEHKIKIGLSKIGKKRPDVSERVTELNKKNTGVNNNFFGKTHSLESLQKMSLSRKGKYKGANSIFSKPVIDLNTGVFYYSVTELAKLININTNTLSRKLAGTKTNNTSYVYA